MLRVLYNHMIGRIDQSSKDRHHAFCQQKQQRLMMNKHSNCDKMQYCIKQKYTLQSKQVKRRIEHCRSIEGGALYSESYALTNRSNNK